MRARIEGTKEGRKVRRHVNPTKREKRDGVHRPQGRS